MANHNKSVEAEQLISEAIFEEDRYKRLLDNVDLRRVCELNKPAPFAGASDIDDIQSAGNSILDNLLGDAGSARFGRRTHHSHPTTNAKSPRRLNDGGFF